MSRIKIATDEFGAKAQTLYGTQFYCLSKSGVGGFNWQHGASIAFYKGRYYASWGRNLGEENTRGEQCVVYSSYDLRSWDLVQELVDGGDMGYSHGSLSVIGDKLYLFAPYFAGSDSQSPTGIRFKSLSMKVFYLTDSGFVSACEDVSDFWPLQQAEKTASGNYVVAGINGLWQACVAISQDLKSWKTVAPSYGEGRAFTESNVIVSGDTLTLLIRNEKSTNPDDVTLGISKSLDGGLSWSNIEETNMPANTSKVCCGVLSCGKEYVITNSIKGANRSRGALTLALKGDSGLFDRLYLIRNQEIPTSLKQEYAPLLAQEAMSYPFAMEREGKLYVSYSSFMKKGCNYNNIELAVIDLAQLK